MSWSIADTRCQECHQRPASSTGLCGFCESKLSIGGMFSGSGFVVDAMTAIGHLDFEPSLDPDPDPDRNGRCTALMNDSRTVIMLRVDAGDPWTDADLDAVIEWVQDRRKESRDGDDGPTKTEPA